MRPLFQLPQWDGKLFLAGLFLVGYYGTLYLIRDARIPAANLAVIRDQLVLLGPVIGLIFGALFRFTLSDERDAERRNETLKTAIETPSIVTPDVLKDPVREGAREGTKEGVEDALQNGTNEELPEYAR